MKPSPSRQSTWPRGAERPFTLLELVILMTTLAVLAGVLSASLGGFLRGRSLKEEARRFMAATRYAQSEAVSRSEVADLVIEPELGSYYVEVRELGCPRPCDDRPLEVVQGVMIDLGEAEADEDGRFVIRFHPDGRISPNGIQEVGLRNAYDDDDLLMVVMNEASSRYVIEVEPEE